MAENTPQLPPGHHSRKWYKQRGLPIPDPNTATVPTPATVTEPQKPDNTKPIDRWLALVAIVVGILLWLLPKTKSVIVACCAAMWLLLVHPAVNFWWVESKRWRQAMAIALLTVGLAWLGYSIPSDKPTESDSLHVTTAPDRHLTIAQADSLRAALEHVNFISSVEVAAPQNDGEAWDYGSELASAFNNAKDKAGWKVNSLVPIPAWDPSPGVTLLVWQGGERSVSEQQIGLAFMEAGLDVPKHGVSPKLRRGEVIIWVGKKD